MGKHDRSKKKSKNRNLKRSRLSILRSKFKQVYKSWGKRVFCPALSEYVYFNNTWWNHLINTSRENSDIERRLKLLPLAKRLIQESPHKPIIAYRIYRGKKTKYWKLKGVLDNNEIAVIIIRVYPGIYVFLSDQDVWEK